MDLVGYHLALGATERHVGSARPNAPVRPDRDPSSGGGPGRLRRSTATMLRLVADRLAPAPAARPSSATRTCTP
ncbi:hypothetical protein [Plantactinospora endophytica]|uniref:Uncharacterized protein n=1 Tax=Plantactinospora endophytica TaxID=673535 RepID=A0ABQ4E647_9ACTN|nr:hypothetical protein [Plantactinospora endophytica]GIG90194.1 hypothetical protein Pen02_51300 [Plantactinospora endophytica]